MTDFSNTVLVTDLDGTLLPHSKIVLQKDLDAIEHFKNCGGTFTIATGRIYQAAEQFFDVLKPNAPVILNNGGLIYDIDKKETIYNCFLDKSAWDYTVALMRHFPEIGVEINLPDGIYAIRMTEWERRHLDMTHLPYKEKKLDEIPKDGWCKVLFSIENRKMHELEDYTASMGWDRTSFVSSGDFLFECLPKEATKGFALKKLAEVRNWESFTIAAAGDYNNDLEMLEFADIAFAPQNAQDIVKKSAAYITKATCEEGAIAEAIEYIEKKCKVK